MNGTMRTDMSGRIKMKKMTERVYLMDDNGEATGYVVVGTKKALVIDTMNGIADVKAAVRTVTGLPITVINTHGHCDHISGNIYFDEAYLNPADMDIAREHSGFDGFVKLMQEKNLKMPPFKEINDGDEIDIGGDVVKVIKLPGHTPGSILLLLKEERILFTGDAINRHLWLQLDHSLSPEDCLKEYGKVLYLTGQADHILHGHATDFEPVTLINELYDALGDLCAGNTEHDMSYGGWQQGEPMLHAYGTDRVVEIVYQKR